MPYRELYLACKGDREQVCPNIQSGEGRYWTPLAPNLLEVSSLLPRVYHCLTMAKDKVSPPCQVQLSKRQALAAQDFKADASLLDTCSEELTRLQCGVQGPGEGAVRLSQVLLCLEGHLRDGQKVGEALIGVYCTVLYCILLYCTLLFFTVLYFTLLYCTVLLLV